MSGQAAAHAAVGGLDEAIKEYLLYRGFTQSLKWFEQERKDDKDKGFRVRKGWTKIAYRQALGVGQSALGGGRDAPPIKFFTCTGKLLFTPWGDRCLTVCRELLKFTEAYKKI